MSKYDRLWKAIQADGSPSIRLTFEEIGRIAGAEIDHSFLKFKTELLDYGYEVAKISMKAQTVCFQKRN